MRKPRSTRGSALLIATVVVLMAVGIGGAFLASSLMHAKEQALVIEADEAMTMCDAGMERARQALGVYKTGKQWTLDQIMQYCYNNMSPKPTDPTLPPDPLVIKADYLSRKNTAQFTTYTGALWGTNPAVNVTAPGLPVDPAHISPQTADLAANVVLGWNIPYHKGAIHLYIRNNKDSSTPDPSGVAGSTFHDSDGTFMVTVTATMPSGLQRQIDGTVSWPPPGGNGAFHALGAVVAFDSVNTNGNTTIDGRDYFYSAATGATTALSGNPGVPGIVSGNSIGVGGSSGVGGNNSAPPAKGAAAGATVAGYNFPGGYPPTPDSLMNVPSGTLKATAQAQGTYFSTEAAYTSMLTANGGKLPDQAIIYLDFTPGNGTFELGSGNTRSSILVVHTDSYTGTIGEVHGSFTGALFADSIVRVNAGTSITGMVQLFSPTSSTAGNVLGNGNSNIRYSSAALNDLPAANPGSTALPMLGSRRTL